MSDYDKFAKKYSEAMGEKGDFFHRTQIDPFIYSMIGNPKGKITYDIGCGNGYIARNLSRKGAHVYASDISSKLIDIAIDKSKGLDIEYLVHDATDFTNYKSSQFDIVILNTVVNYIKNLDKLFKGISKVLKKDGKCVIATNHFLRPVYPYSDWIIGEIDGKKTLFTKVTHYLKTIKKVVVSGWDNKIKIKLYNRPLNIYVNTLSKYGLYLERVEEPESSGFARNFSKKLQKSHLIPTYLIFSAKKMK